MIFDKFDSLVCNGKLTSIEQVIFDLTLFLNVKSVTKRIGAVVVYKGMYRLHFCVHNYPLGMAEF